MKTGKAYKVLYTDREYITIRTSLFRKETYSFVEPCYEPYRPEWVVFEPSDNNTYSLHSVTFVVEPTFRNRLHDSRLARFFLKLLEFHQNSADSISRYNNYVYRQAVVQNEIYTYAESEQEVNTETINNSERIENAQTTEESINFDQQDEEAFNKFFDSLPNR